MMRSSVPAERGGQASHEPRAPTRVGAAGGLTRDHVLALRAAAGNRAVARLLAPRARLARVPAKSSDDDWVVHPEAMKFLGGKLKALYQAIPRRDRIRLKARGTVAIGIARHDGDVRLVYTVNQNGGSAEFHAAAEKLDLHRWVYDSGIDGRGAVGAPNDAEQLMTGFAEDNEVTLDGMVVSRRLCKDCATVVPAYGGGRLRVAEVPDTADLPNPYNPPSRLTPPARTAGGTTGARPPNAPASNPPSAPAKVAVDDPGLRGTVIKGTQTEHVPSGTVFHGGSELPPGSVFAEPYPIIAAEPPIIAVRPASLEGSPPVAAKPQVNAPEPPIHVPGKAASVKGVVRAALVPVGIMGASVLAGFLVGWYQKKQFQDEWEARMHDVEGCLQASLPALRRAHRPGTPLFAVVEIDIDTGTSYMGEGGWTSNAPGVAVHAIQVTERYAFPSSGIADKSAWWTMLLGFSYKTTRVTFSFPLPNDH
jgi:hypothetical protein